MTLWDIVRDLTLGLEVEVGELGRAGEEFGEDIQLEQGAILVPIPDIDSLGFEAYLS